MNLKQCSNMHYYDGDIHAECPYCSHPEKQQYQDITQRGIPVGNNRRDRGTPLFDNSGAGDDKTELQL